MKSFEQIDASKVQLKIDTTIYNETVISKVLYWLFDRYIIYREKEENNVQNIIIEKKAEELYSTEELNRLKDKINQDFIDFKVRDIVNRETKNIRDILYIKAFSNNDEFTDYNLTGD
jgi:His-Xaa-Ser system protein HxsD